MLCFHLTPPATVSNVVFDRPVVAQPMGSAPIDRILIGREDGPAALAAVEDRLSQEPLPGAGPVFCMLFDLVDGAGVDEMRRYVEDRAPALERHQGTVLLSATHAPVAGWPFHGIELIRFPGPANLQAIMGDPLYQERTKESSRIFAGAFAVLVLGEAAAG